MPYPRFVLLLPLASCVLLPACGDAGGPETAAFQVDTLASGRIHVTNDTVGQWTAETRWTVVEELRLGCTEGCGPELFSQVSYITTDAEGQLYVLDDQTQEIRVFTARGEHLRTLGGQGQGPGELDGASGLDWGPDGNLWVWGGTFYFVLRPSGEEVARYQRRIRGIIYPWMGGFAPDGRYVDFGVEAEATVEQEDGNFVMRTDGRYMIYPLAFTPPDQFDSLPMLEFTAEVTDDRQLKEEFTNLVGIQDAQGDFWFAHSDEYTIYRRTLEGDTLLTFSRPATPMPVPTAEMDSLIGAAVERGAPMPRSHDDFAIHRWIVTNVLTDDAGHVFVLPQEDGLPAGQAVDVFEESGVYLGRIMFPEPVLTEGPPPHITDDHIYAVLENELGIPFVVGYRIVKP